MTKKIAYFECMFLLGCFVEASFGATFLTNHWQNGNPLNNYLWQEPNNWSRGRVPVYYNDGELKYDVVYINYVQSAPGGCVIEDGNNSAYSIYISRDGGICSEPAILTMNGGYLWVQGWELKLGFDEDSNSCPAIFNLNGGTVDVTGGGGICVGYGAGSRAEINMNGGRIFTQKLRIPFEGSGAQGRLNLYGGTINVGLGNYFIVEKPGKINITQGSLEISGNVESYVNNLIQNGLIVAYGGNGTVNVNYDISSDEIQVTASADVVVDFSTDLGLATHRASGFLHSISSALPDDNLIKPLKPQTFRMTPHHRFGNTEGAFEIYDRIKSFGADIHAVLGDGFKDSGVGWPGDNNDWTLWENYVESLVTEALLSGYDVAWDIWNEANVENYWNPAGTAAEKKLRFFETWKRAWLMIKALDPNAIIVGPGNSAYISMPNRLFSVEEFLIFARDNGVLPDILSWHVWDEDTIIPDTSRARTFMADNNINIEKISISEYGGRSQHTMPGVFVWYFANLEQAGVDMAMRACSVDPNGCSTCWNVSLDGLLTLPELEPRSTWWVYKSYADMTGTLVNVTGDNNINGLAAKDSDAGSVLREPKAIILLGKRSGTITDVSVLLTGLEKVSYIKNCGGNVRLIIEHIPDSGWESLSEPVIITDQIIPLSEAMNLILPDFGPTDAYVITIRNPNFYKSDFDSLALLSSNWLNDNSNQQNCSFNIAGDLTGDCKVNFDDFGVMALYWCQQ